MDIYEQLFCMIRDRQEADPDKNGRGCIVFDGGIDSHAAFDYIESIAEDISGIAYSRFREEEHPRNAKGGKGGGQFRTSQETIEKEDDLSAEKGTGSHDWATEEISRLLDEFEAFGSPMKGYIHVSGKFGDGNPKIGVALKERKDYFDERLKREGPDKYRSAVGKRKAEYDKAWDDFCQKSTSRIIGGRTELYARLEAEQKRKKEAWGKRARN